jgi:prevent-host-death family protein
MASAPSHIVTSIDAKNRFGRLLDRVEAGEELVITRHGEPVAKLVPIKDRTGENASAAALETFRQIRQSLTRAGGKISRAEIQLWKNQGRR